MTIFWILIYNIFFVPFAFFFVYLSGLFNKKMQTGIRGRKQTLIEMARFRDKFPRKELYLIHSASLGEFEQAKPVIRGLKALRPDILIVASFTSPSGYTNAVRMKEVDLYMYLPFDTFLRTRRFIQRLKPKKIIFVTYELWPNLILNAQRHHVKTYLISARIRENSLKWKPIARTFFCDLYRSLDYIYAISDEHKESVRKLIGTVPIKMLTLGDTRYDQVIHRAHEKVAANVDRLFGDGFVFIIGSIWPQDAKQLMPAVYRCMKEFDSLRVIVAPHEPNEYALETLEEGFSENGILTRRLSTLPQKSAGIRVVLVDRVGILAELYHQSNLAFVGGSFRGSIHNVMEPAVAGIPVLFGPMYHNSSEAELLIREGGGFCCEDSECLYRKIRRMLTDSESYRRAADSARQVILKNLGAGARTVREILESD